ncbi:MAG: glucose 1-dehydrogenase [Gammaproteobacteria bacterium]|mgnify:FL=1|jgi:2-deoxy-D-gluconate 3-dehydrogenase|nr:glucose 1-dehydrogenase [Gammaproteobacteria bacterium]GIT27858.1 MAG: 2-deoxy-D-gluconate 3-dehydrogenase [Gammaproteobacteria bacterium]GIT47657.1 MAG: 2-deoxy-D-gluconate 3-dehydrogenase [Gammaproteobacteria bacterium]|tara:strand:+ start:181 stop:936 length:756 start_codon:yes stop_codon:yes gene_type:complete
MDLFDLSNKVAIVTGGNGGIGLGMARGLAAAGATLAVVGRNAEKNQIAVDELGANARAFVADVTNAAEVDEMVSEVVKSFGGIDILINNAGTNIRKRPEDLSESEWHHVLDTNLTSAFLCSKACYPEMKRRGGGKILNNGSMTSLFSSPWLTAYGSSKGGMVQFTRGLATAWAEDNIQANCFLPGWIDTDLTRRAREQNPDLHQQVLTRTPADRWGEINDMSGIAVFLASAASDFVTGTAIPIDGGFSASI